MRREHLVSIEQTRAPFQPSTQRQTRTRFWFVFVKHQSSVREKIMGLLDSIASQVTGALGGQNPAGGPDWGLIGSLINNPQTGGLQGLNQSFQDKGLGGVVSSWVGTGENLPISAEQLTSVSRLHCH
jgi:hypothetical protein